MSVREFFETALGSVNTAQLLQELAGTGLTIGSVVDLLSEGRIAVDVPDALDAGQRATAQAAIDAHVAVDYAERQAQAEQDFSGLPDWAKWTADQMEAYIDANVTNLATAIVVLKAMARMHAAERNKLWPNLEGN
jgi:hypothetical protein